MQLHARLPESSVASLVQRQTLYLTEDLEHLLAEVRRCGPGSPHGWAASSPALCAALRHGIPLAWLHVSFAIEPPRLCLCRLFGMPDDDAALRVIEHNPDVIMEVTSNRHLSLW